jgi:hypothetical protein
MLLTLNPFQQVKRTFNVTFIAADLRHMAYAKRNYRKRIAQ